VRQHPAQLGGALKEQVALPHAGLGVEDGLALRAVPWGGVGWGGWFSGWGRGGLVGGPGVVEARGGKGVL